MHTKHNDINQFAQLRARRPLEGSLWLRLTFVLGLLWEQSEFSTDNSNTSETIYWVQWKYCYFLLICPNTCNSLLPKVES